MGAKIEKMKWGTWTVTFEGDRMIVTHGDGPKRFEFVDDCTGWIDGFSYAGDRTTIYNGGWRRDG